MEFPETAGNGGGDAAVWLRQSSGSSSRDDIFFATPGFQSLDLNNTTSSPAGNSDGRETAESMQYGSDEQEVSGVDLMGDERARKRSTVQVESHVQSERKRRSEMKELMQQLKTLVPENLIQKKDQVSILRGAVTYLESLQHVVRGAQQWPNPKEAVTAITKTAEEGVPPATLRANPNALCNPVFLPNYRELFMKTMLPMVVSSLDGRIVDANPAFLELFGFDETDVVSSTMGQLTHPDDLPQMYRVMNSLLESQRGGNAEDGARCPAGMGQTASDHSSSSSSGDASSCGDCQFTEGLPPNTQCVVKRCFRKDGEVLKIKVQMSTIATENRVTHVFCCVTSAMKCGKKS